MGKAVRRVTAEKKERLNYLAEILYHFLPLDSASKSTVTFKTIFKESSIGSYLQGPKNKKQALEKGLVNLYRYHKNLPKKIIRKVIPAAINYRMYKRNPLTRDELNELSTCLKDLGINMEEEVCAVNINEELPRITVPPEELKNSLRQHDLHPAISTEPFQLFEDGHFNEAVRKASERFEDLVQEISSIDSSGRDLMGKAFSDGSYLNLAEIKPENQESFIDGYKFLSMGAMAAIRNIFSHGDEERRSPEECFEMLLFFNWLFRLLKVTN